MKIIDIAFVIFAAVILFLLIRELIPGDTKKFWSYVRQTRKEMK